MSDGMSDYWKAKKARAKEDEDFWVASAAKKALARIIGKPHLAYKDKNPILFVNNQRVDMADIVSSSHMSIQPVDVLGKFEVVEDEGKESN